MLAKTRLSDFETETCAERELKIGDVIPGDGRPTPKALAHYFATEVDELAELHSIDPWWLMQCRGHAEELACRSLKKEGFETYYPSYSKFRPMPQNRIASHMRHKKRKVICKTSLPLYPGYVLFRPLDRSAPFYDIFRLYELDGCGGLCTWSRGGVIWKKEGTQDLGPHRIEPILIHDYRVEEMRAVEAFGLNDVFEYISEHAVMTGVVKDLRRARIVQTSGKVMARVDECHRSSLFIDRGDRVIRVIASRADAAEVGR